MKDVTEIRKLIIQFVNKMEKDICPKCKSDVTFYKLINTTGQGMFYCYHCRQLLPMGDVVS